MGDYACGRIQQFPVVSKVVLFFLITKEDDFKFGLRQGSMFVGKVQNKFGQFSFLLIKFTMNNYFSL